MKLSGTAHTVTVGDANVASARVVFGNTLMVLGKNPGRTNIVALDENGAEIDNIALRVLRADGRRTMDVISGGVRETHLCGSEPNCRIVDPEPSIRYDQVDEVARGLAQ